MKSLFVAMALVYSMSVFACPNLTGSFDDADAETVRTITQDGCLSTTWSDGDGTTVMVADKVERVLESEGNMTAYAAVSFTNEDLIIDIRMDYGGYNEFDLPVRWITSYRIDKYNNLVEKIQPFKEDGTALGIDYVTFRRKH